MSAASSSHSSTPPQSYEAAGVSVATGDAFAGFIKAMAVQHYKTSLPKASGGYAAVIPFTETQWLALTTDGVGTKVLVAQEFGQHHGVGIDLVGMCANDLICVGATPVAFLDYYASGNLNPDEAKAFIGGVFEACQETGMRLVGGETAEMPDVYQDGHYDCAGFAVGMVTPNTLLTGDAVKPGQWVIGLASSGIHSNGLSLARKVLQDPEHRQALLTPTRLYVKAMPIIRQAIEQANVPMALTGVAHVTGGGWRNLFRLNPTIGFEVDSPLPVPEVFDWIKSAAQLPDLECYHTFNMGLGLVIIIEAPDKSALTPLLEALNQANYPCGLIGKTTTQAGTITLPNLDITIQQDA